MEIIIQSLSSENPQAQDADLSLWLLYISGKPIWVSVWNDFCNHIIKYGWMAIISNLPLMQMRFSLSHWIVVNVTLFLLFFQSWIEMLFHQFSLHLPQLPLFFCFVTLCLSFSPFHLFPFILLCSCCPVPNNMWLSATLPLPCNHQSEMLKEWRAWHTEAGASLWVTEGPWPWMARTHSPLFTHPWASAHPRAWYKPGPQSKVKDASLDRGLPSHQPGLWGCFQVMIFLW